jgi:hypothetical protein
MTLCKAYKEYRFAKKLNCTNPRIIQDLTNNTFTVTWYYSDKLINKVYKNLFVI